MTIEGKRLRELDKLARRGALGESCKEQPLPRTAAVHTAVAGTSKESHIGGGQWAAEGRSLLRNRPA